MRHPIANARRGFTQWMAKLSVGPAATNVPFAQRAHQIVWAAREITDLQSYQVVNALMAILTMARTLIVLCVKGNVTLVSDKQIVAPSVN